eukprot:scaffold5300_cov48-Cyclotella_meneghiniana.AAC.2
MHRQSCNGTKRIGTSLSTHRGVVRGHNIGYWVLGIIDHRSSREHRRELLPMPAIRPRCIPNQWGIWIYTLTGASEDGKCLTYYAVTKC